MTTTEIGAQACYVYGIVAADAPVPDGLRGLDGAVSKVQHRDLAAVIGDLPRSRSIGNRSDLLAHEQVIDSIAATTTILPMRFAAAVDSPQGLIDEMLEPYQDQLVNALEELSGHVQFILHGEYDHDAVLRELLTQDREIARLRDDISKLSEDASYPLRLQQGELIVQALERRRVVDAEQIHDALDRYAAASTEHELGTPSDVIDTAFLVEESRQARFERAVEKVGEKYAGRVRFRLLGPLAVYDFVPRM